MGVKGLKIHGFKFIGFFLASQPWVFFLQLLVCLKKQQMHSVHILGHELFCS